MEKEKIEKVLEICQKIKDIEHKKMDITMNNGEVYDPAIISWIQNIERILITLPNQ